MLRVYREFPVTHQSAFGAFLNEAEKGRTLLYHCSTEKDTAGFATMPLVSALDVAPDTIVANYLESNHWNQRLIKGLLARLASFDIAPDVSRCHCWKSAQALSAGVIANHRTGMGQHSRVLRAALSVDVQRLQAHYLDEAT